MGTTDFAYTTFLNHIKSSEQLIEVFRYLESLHFNRLKSDEILRSTIVLTISSLDTFLHDFFRMEIVQAYVGNSAFLVDFKRLQISIDSTKSIELSTNTIEKMNLLELELRRLQKTDSYQSPKSIEYIFTTLGIGNIWKALEKETGLAPLKANDIKTKLALIIERRNQISHEADWDFTINQKREILIEDVEDIISFIKKLVFAIHSIIPNTQT